MATQSIYYFPPFSHVKKPLQFKSVRGEVQVSLPYDTFSRLVQLMARSVVVDEEWYLTKNPDVRAAIQKGQFRNAKQHWTEVGYQEGRLPHELTIDSEWYLSNYPDVAKAIQEGLLESALAHYRNVGFQEGRLPSSD